MARESAHQLGTPLSSLGGWIELLEERATDDDRRMRRCAHMRGDLERLDRVAHRFERIGREPKFEDDRRPARSSTRIVAYFQARVPTLANTVVDRVDVAADLPLVHGDPVLLEWAVEVLTKNAIDALAGRGGRVRVSARAAAGRRASSIRVADDGPGIPRELRARVFEPGFSTKQSGWGIGLSLAKRIVEENHGGKLDARADGARRDVRDYPSLMSMLLEEQLTAGLNPAQREAVLHSMARCSCSPARVRERRACSRRASRG